MLASMATDGATIRCDSPKISMLEFEHLLYSLYETEEPLSRSSYVHTTPPGTPCFEEDDTESLSGLSSVHTTPPPKPCLQGTLSLRDALRLAPPPPGFGLPQARSGASDGTSALLSVTSRPTTSTTTTAVTPMPPGILLAKAGRHCRHARGDSSVGPSAPISATSMLVTPTSTTPVAPTHQGRSFPVKGADSRTPARCRSSTSRRSLSCASSRAAAGGPEAHGGGTSRFTTATSTTPVTPTKPLLLANFLPVQASRRQTAGGDYDGSATPTTPAVGRTCFVEERLERNMKKLIELAPGDEQYLSFPPPVPPGAWARSPAAHFVTLAAR